MKKVSHIILSLILLISTMGVTVSKHYCGGELQTVSLNSKPDGCGDSMPMDMNCCDDQTQYFSLDDDFQPVQFSVEIDQPSFESLFNSYVLIPTFEIQDPENKRVGNFQYPPPRTEIYVRIESFLL